MTEDGAARVDRLIAWIRKHRRAEFCGHESDPDRVSPSKLALATPGRRVSYWSDVLGKKAKKSFGATAARETEEQLGIPILHLESGGWPFDAIDQERYERLSERQKGRIEQAILDVMTDIERTTLGGGGPDPHRREPVGRKVG